MTTNGLQYIHTLHVSTDISNKNNPIKKQFFVLRYGRNREHFFALIFNQHYITYIYLYILYCAQCAVVTKKDRFIKQRKGEYISKISREKKRTSRLQRVSITRLRMAAKKF